MKLTITDPNLSNHLSLFVQGYFPLELTGVAGALVPLAEST